jgi:hypothetical protein
MSVKNKGPNGEDLPHGISYQIRKARRLRKNGEMKSYAYPRFIHSACIGSITYQGRTFQTLEEASATLPEFLRLCQKKAKADPAPTKRTSRMALVKRRRAKK